MKPASLRLKRLSILGGALLLGAALQAGPVQAADLTAREKASLEADKPETSFVLDPVVVTARKREELVQEVPVSITTITEQDIQDTGLEDMSKVIMMTPGLNGMQAGQATSSTFNIRGIGTLGAASGWEDGSISAYVDGVPIPIGQLDSYILDVEQIEVLRGPQGTLFGKTAQGGAINITTAAPQSIFGGRIGTTVGTLGRQGVDAMVTGPIVKDRLNARLFIDAQSKDGNIKNSNTGEPLGNIERYFARGALDAFWTDNFTTRINIGYDKFDNDDMVQVPVDNYNEVNLVTSPKEKRDTISLGIINKIDFTDNFRLHLVTGFNRIEYDTRSETVTGLLPSLDETEYHASQEIRFEGEYAALEWTTGLFASYFKRDINHWGSASSLLPYDMNYHDIGKQEANTLAAFGEGTFTFTENWKLTTGARLNRDYRSVDETVSFSGTYWTPFVHRMNESKTNTDWNGRVILSYLPSENHTLFASVSRGYKPGGYQTYHNSPFQGMADRTPDFNESTSWAYELGYKGLYFNQRLSLDLSAFFNDTKGECILGFTSAGSSVFYNMDTYSYGLEMASRLRVTRNLTVGTGASLNRAELREGKVLVDMGALGRDEVFKGDALPSVPRFSSHVFSEYRTELTEKLSLFARGDFVWKSKTYMDITHYTANKAQGMLNLRLGLENESFSVTAYADNVTDRKYITYALGNFSAMGVYPGRGREIGMKISVYF